MQLLIGYELNISLDTVKIVMVSSSANVERLKTLIIFTQEHSKSGYLRQDESGPYPESGSVLWIWII